MAKPSKGVLIARDCTALDQATVKARSRAFYAKRKAKPDHPRLSSAIEVANAVLAYGLDSRPGNPSGHPHALAITPVSERQPGFSRSTPNPVVNEVTRALDELDTQNPDKMADQLRKEAESGRLTWQQATAIFTRAFPNAESLEYYGKASKNAQANDAGLTVQQIIDSL